MAGWPVSMLKVVVLAYSKIFSKRLCGRFVEHHERCHVKVPGIRTNAVRFVSKNLPPFPPILGVVIKITALYTYLNIFNKYQFYHYLMGGGRHAVAQLVEGPCYKPESRGFNSRWCHWNFSQTRQKWVTGIFPWGSRRPVCGTDYLTTFICRLSRNLGASTSWKPQGL
jgi:hypothetical protein